MACSFVATRGSINKTLPPRRKKSKIDVTLQEYWSGADATVRDELSDADKCLVTELWQATGRIRHIWS